MPLPLSAYGLRPGDVIKLFARVEDNDPAGAKGSEKLAIKWSRQKGVKLILARADFDTHGKAAPFRANDELIALEPTCCLTLAHSLDRTQSEDQRPFGPALNLGQKAMESGLRHVPIRARAA